MKISFNRKMHFKKKMKHLKNVHFTKIKIVKIVIYIYILCHDINNTNNFVKIFYFIFFFSSLGEVKKSFFFTSNNFYKNLLKSRFPFLSDQSVDVVILF